MRGHSKCGSYAHLAYGRDHCATSPKTLHEEGRWSQARARIWPLPIVQGLGQPYVRARRCFHSQIHFYFHCHCHCFFRFDFLHSRSGPPTTCFATLLALYAVTQASRATTLLICMRCFSEPSVWSATTCRIPAVESAFGLSTIWSVMSSLPVTCALLAAAATLLEVSC